MIETCSKSFGLAEAMDQASREPKERVLKSKFRHEAKDAVIHRVAKSNSETPTAVLDSVIPIKTSFGSDLFISATGIASGTAFRSRCSTFRLEHRANESVALSCVDQILKPVGEQLS